MVVYIAKSTVSNVSDSEKNSLFWIIGLKMIGMDDDSYVCLSLLKIHSLEDITTVSIVHNEISEIESLLPSGMSVIGWGLSACDDLNQTNLVDKALFNAFSKRSISQKPFLKMMVKESKLESLHVCQDSSPAHLLSPSKILESESADIWHQILSHHFLLKFQVDLSIPVPYYSENRENGELGTI